MRKRSDDVSTGADGGRKKGARRRRRWGAALAAVLATYAAYCGVMYAVQDRMIFPGASLTLADGGGPRDPDIEQIWITTEDGFRVEAWYQAGEGRTAESPGPAVIFFHGNADLIDRRWAVGRRYLKRGVSFLLPEYRGYGRSEGAPSQDGIVTDMVQFRDWLAKRPEVDGEQIVFHGISLGGGVAVAVAEERRPAALVLESTFTSVVSLSSRYLVPSFLCRHPFRSDQVIGGLQVPVFIMHGRQDRLIPVEHGRRLHSLAPGSVYVEDDTGHDNHRTDWGAILAFLDDHGLGGIR